MQIRKFILAGIASVAVSTAFSQEFGTWTEASVEKKVSKKVSVSAGAELRTGNGMQNVDRWSVGIGASYRLTDWLKADAGYTLLYDYHERDTTYNYSKKGVLRPNKITQTYFGMRHRVYVSLTGNMDVGKLGISLRERWQYTYRPAVDNIRMDSQDSEDDEGYGYTYPVKGKGKNVWRNRLQFGYRLTKVFKPYASIETYMANGWDKLRFAAGCEAKLDKNNSIDIGYRFQKVYDGEEPDSHILSISYKYKF
jgi:opacity protein-like surface antigen